MQDVVTEAKSTFKYKEKLIKADDYSITLSSEEYLLN